MKKIYIILLSIFAISSSISLCAMKYQTIAATKLLDLPTEMLIQIAQMLGNRDLGHLNQASWEAHVVTQEIVQQRRHEQWLFDNRIMVDCSDLRNNHPDVDDFINAVLEKLALAYTDHPDRWFGLNLALNNLGNPSENDLQRVFDTIGKTAESLKIHIFSLWLHNNQLQTLPNNIFDNLVNLQRLYLSNNQLHTLPNNIFDNLVNLQDLWLSNNQLHTLPNNIFDRLGNLEWLSLSNNQFDHATLNTLQALKTAQPGIDIHF